MSGVMRPADSGQRCYAIVFSVDGRPFLCWFLLVIDEDHVPVFLLIHHDPIFITRRARGPGGRLTREGTGGI